MTLSERLEHLASYLQSTDTSADADEHLAALEQATIIVLRWELAKCVQLIPLAGIENQEMMGP